MSLEYQPRRSCRNWAWKKYRLPVRKLNSIFLGYLSLTDNEGGVDPVSTDRNKRRGDQKVRRITRRGRDRTRKKLGS